MRSRRLRTLLLLGACALAAAIGAAPADAAAPATVADTQPAWADASNLSGAVAGGDRMVFSVWLGWRNTSDLDRTLASLYDPASPGYHRWLTPDQFHARYSPAPAQVAAVRAWLTDAGFRIVDVPGNRLFVTASGTVSQVESTFDVAENMYRIDGTTVRAPDADPSVPQGIAPYVRAITGLDGSLALATPEHSSPAPPPPAGTSVGPCSRYWGERTSSLFTNPYAPGTPLPWLICGYTPAQIDSAYGVSPLRRFGLDGRGQTIAITGAFFSPTIQQDANSFSRDFGLPPLGPWNYRQIVAPGTLRYPQDPAETQSWYIEQALDVEWTHAVAPGARIVYVGAANDAGGLDQAVNDVVDHHLANIVSNSWGLPESLAPRGEIMAMNGVFEQAAAEGIGVYFASGDDGDNRLAAGKVSAGFPDSSPWVTSVGGTSLAIDAHGGYEWEAGWGTTTTDWNGTRWAPKAPGDFMYGSGGGPSHVFAIPSYQVGVVPSALATWHGVARRTEPDIAMDADPQTGVTFAQTYVEPNGHRRIIDSWIGGTSLAAPLAAGVMALADQLSGHPHGFVNPALYGLAGSPAMHDVVGGHRSLAVLRNALQPDGSIVTHLRSLDRDSSLTAAPGWDPVTGLGSFNVPYLLAALR
ncbi:MAG TPA: S53 family peptidase [Gaiellales bacterium]